MIADALGLRYPLNRLHAFGGTRPMHLNSRFNQGIIANLGPAEFEMLIDNEVVRNFTLPNHEKTNIHNRDNWFYNLDGQGESPKRISIMFSSKFIPCNTLLDRSDG